MSKEINEIKQEINKLVRTFVHRPQDVYIKKITKNEIDVIVDMDNGLIKLSCRTWQDNYFSELVQRARLDLCTYTFEGNGRYKYISSQHGCDEKPDKVFTIIERVINSFNEISNYHEKIKKLSLESPDISPGSPMDKLNEEFYGKIEEWMI